MTFLTRLAKRKAQPQHRARAASLPGLRPAIVHAASFGLASGCEVSDTQPITYSAAPRIVRPNGVCSQLNAAGNAVADAVSPATRIEYPDSAWNRITGSLTAVVHFRFFGMTQYANRGLLAKARGYAAGASTSERAYSLYIDAQTTAGTFYLRGAVSSTGASFVALTPVSGKPTISTGDHTAVLVYEAGKRLSVWLDGQLYSETTTGVPSTIAATTAPLWIGAQYTTEDAVQGASGYCLPGAVYAHALYRGAAYDELAQRLSQKSSQGLLFSSTERRIWVPVSTGGISSSVVGLAVENSTSFALGLVWSSSGITGLATETVAALALSSKQKKTIELSTATDFALSLPGKQKLPVSLATDAAAAFSLSAKNKKQASICANSEFSFALTSKQSRLAGIAVDASYAVYTPAFVQTVAAWTGGAWTYGELKRWNGFNWERAKLNRWTGAAWVNMQ